jgi:hypothetical protein
LGLHLGVKLPTGQYGTDIPFRSGPAAGVTGKLSVFAFAQVPVYSDLVGYQLFPRYAFSLGASYAF